MITPPGTRPASAPSRKAVRIQRTRLAAAAALLLLAGCSHHGTEAAADLRTQTLRVGNAGEPADLDPQVVMASNDANIDYALFEPLTWIDEKTVRPVPAAAASWDVSPDGLVYTFHLRPDGRWSDGRPVTADDFAWSYRRILTPAFAASYSYMLWPIKNAQDFNAGRITDFSQVGVKALDPLTLQITLTKPTPYLPSLAAHQTWLPVPRQVIEQFGPYDRRSTAWTRPGHLVGNGPFVLKEWTPHAQIVLEKNPFYRDAAHVRLQRIVFYPIENGDAEEAAFRAGQLDVTYGLPAPKIATYRRDHADELRIEGRLATYYLFINVTRPPLDNAQLRRALALAIDRTAIARDVLAGSRLPAHAFTPADCAGYTCRAGVPDDFAAARRLLAAAGYPGGRGLPTFEVLSYDTGGSIHALEAIQAMWLRELGVHITIAPLEERTLFQDQRTRNYTIAFSAWLADYADPSTFLDTMVTDCGNNWAGWSDPAYDRLIAAAESTADNARRYELFQQAEAILLDQAPLIPLFNGEQSYLVRPDVRHWHPSPLSFQRFQDVWLGPR
ncbi:MAG TPA: peptide ABC transporter substrate-binding protein [Opitutaceae bacterium]|nr:peptide ABC transporter substrate-binding protein [Opitutaceae bacterium]